MYIKFIYSGALSNEVSFYHYPFRVLFFSHYLEKINQWFKNDQETGGGGAALDFFLPSDDLHTCRGKRESENTTVCAKNKCASQNQGAKKREVEGSIRN